MNVLPARATEAVTEFQGTVLYVAAAEHARTAVLDRLGSLNIPAIVAPDLRQALNHLATRHFALTLVDLAGDRTALALIRSIRAAHPNIAIAAVVDSANPLATGEAIQAGAFDLVPWPFEDRDLIGVWLHARDAMPSEPPTLQSVETTGAAVLVQQSTAMRAAVARVHAVANTRASLFVCGEPGSGRALVARVIHSLARGVDAPFVAESCTEQPEEIERRLFGVGGEGRKQGPRSSAFERISTACAFYRARGGTLFVRGLLQAPARVQAKLLRLLRDREAELVGQAGTLVDLDVRVIASVDPLIDDAVADGRMRSDLFERLAQMRVDVPPLRRRREDIPVLAAVFMKESCLELGIPLKGISRSAFKLLTALPWAQNASELRKLIDTLARTVDRTVIQLDDLLEYATFDGSVTRMEPGVSLRDAKARFERECIAAVLARHHGRVGDAARALGIQRTNLYRKVRQLQVARPKARKIG